MSLTEALRAGDPEAFGMLYDEYAERLYAYGHIMIGDEAADAVRDAFIAVARHPGAAPTDDTALPVWLYALARAECVRRGALVRRATAAPSADPLRRALARLRPEHREALALSLTLDTGETARVLNVAPDTADMLIRMSRQRLEQAAASVLGPQAVRDEVALSALHDGDLHRLVMSAYSPPPRQRDRVLFSCAAAERAADGALLFDHDGMPIPLNGLPGIPDDSTRPFPRVDAFSTEVAGPPRWREGEDIVTMSMPTGSAVSASDAPAGRAPGRTGTAERLRPKEEPFLSRRGDGFVEIAGLAACVLAALAAVAFWPSPHDGGPSNMDGSSLLVHHGAAASRAAWPAPSSGGASPPAAATSKPSASSSSTLAVRPRAGTSSATGTPTATAPAKPGTPSAHDPGTVHPGRVHATPEPPSPPPTEPPPTEPPTTGPTPAPSPSSTDGGGDSLLPNPIGLVPDPTDS